MGIDDPFAVSTTPFTCSTCHTASVLPTTRCLPAAAVLSLAERKVRRPLCLCTCGERQNRRRGRQMRIRADQVQAQMAAHLTRPVEMEIDWCSLSQGLLQLLVPHLHGADLLSAAATCRHWRAALTHGLTELVLPMCSRSTISSVRYGTTPPPCWSRVVHTARHCLPDVTHLSIQVDQSGLKDGMLLRNLHDVSWWEGLTSLDIVHAPDSPANCIVAIDRFGIGAIGRLKKLRSLSINSWMRTPLCLSGLSDLTALSTIRLGNKLVPQRWRDTDEDNSDMSNLSSLQTLSMPLTLLSVEALPTLTALTLLDFTSVYHGLLMDNGMQGLVQLCAALQTMTTLRQLNLRSMMFPSGDTTDIASTFFQGLSHGLPDCLAVHLEACIAIPPAQNSTGMHVCQALAGLRNCADLDLHLTGGGGAQCAVPWLHKMTTLSRLKLISDCSDPYGSACVLRCIDMTRACRSLTNLVSLSVDVRSDELGPEALYGLRQLGLQFRSLELSVKAHVSWEDIVQEEDSAHMQPVGVMDESDQPVSYAVHNFINFFNTMALQRRSLQLAKTVRRVGHLLNPVLDLAWLPKNMTHLHVAHCKLRSFQHCSSVKLQSCHIKVADVPTQVAYSSELGQMAAALPHELRYSVQLDRITDWDQTKGHST